MTLGWGMTGPATIRPPITFIAEIFFHGEETYMLLRPEMKRKGVPRPHCSFLYLSLNNLRNHSLEEEWRAIANSRNPLLIVLKRQTILVFFFLSRQGFWGGESDVSPNNCYIHMCVTHTQYLIIYYYIVQHSCAMLVSLYIFLKSCCLMTSSHTW